MASDMPGWNPYHYTFNNPVRYIDPTGLSPEEIARFQQSEISQGLQHMLDLTDEHGVEIAALMVQDGDGNVDLVVFDYSENIPDKSFTRTDGKLGNSKFYKGSEVIAQIHTHTSGDATPGRADRKAAIDLMAPVYTLTHDNIGVTLGGPEAGFRDVAGYGKSFKESVVNRGNSNRLIQHARESKSVINRRRN